MCVFTVMMQSDVFLASTPAFLNDWTTMLPVSQTCLHCPLSHCAEQTLCSSSEG